MENRLQNQDKPVRFKDSRGNEQAEKLREKLRERQLSGAAQNVPETILVPCHVRYLGISRHLNLFRILRFS